MRPSLSSTTKNAPTSKERTIGGKRPFLASLKTTLVDGLTFLLPLMVIGWILQKLSNVVIKLAQPAMALLPDSLVGGILVSALETGLLLLAVVYLAGMLARTSAAHRLIQMVHNSAIGSLPQFRFVRGITESIDDSDEDFIQVVLVPAGAGWSLGFIVRASDAPVVAVYIPGAPQWATGSVVFAERAMIKPAGIDFAEAIQIQKRLGADSWNVARLLTQ